MKLCCEVNPGYLCEACRFCECADCWRETLNAAMRGEESQYHFSEYGSEDNISWGICRMTSTKVWSTKTKPINRWAREKPLSI